MNLHGKTIAVGVTGGIAAYKACEIVSSLKKLGADIFVVMTQNAQEFITPLTLETLSGNRVICGMFEQKTEYEVKHISLAKKADAFLIAPATANFVGKMANGIADDFLSTTVMALTCPIIIAPAMNTNMLLNKAYRVNEQKLKERGVHFVATGEGRLACGDVGSGKLAKPEAIVAEVCRILLPKQDYAQKTVLITAGGTSESIDPVRFITNRSSGKMGVCLAEAATQRGAKVIFIAGNIKYECSPAWQVQRATTTDEMFDAVMQNLESADFIIKAAAPCDYKVQKSAQKIKSDVLTLKLEKNTDIAAEVGKVKGNKKLIIFAAETENLIGNAKKKLDKKCADLVVANDVTKEGAGFDLDTNIATLITKNSQCETGLVTKTVLANMILDKALEL